MAYTSFKSLLTCGSQAVGPTIMKCIDGVMSLIIYIFIYILYNTLIIILLVHHPKRKRAQCAEKER